MYKATSWIGLAMAALLFPLLSWGQYIPKAESATIDGKDDEWNPEELMYDQDHKLIYGIREDEEKIYLMFRTGDQATVRRMTLTGLELWFSPDGKKKRLHGVKYPVGLRSSDMESLKAQSEGAEASDQARFRKMAVKMSTAEIELTGLYGDVGEPIRTPLGALSADLDLKLMTDEQSPWLYEIAFPKDALPEPEKAKGFWRLGIVFPAMEIPDDVRRARNNGNANTNMPPPGANRPMMSDPRMGMGGMQRQPFGGMPMSTLTTDDIIWVKVSR